MEAVLVSFRFSVSASLLDMFNTLEIHLFMPTGYIDAAHVEIVTIQFQFIEKKQMECENVIGSQ